jgi:hypothetical protein
MRFNPVWFTTDEQLATLADVFRGASLATKLLGTFRLPPGTAHLHGLLAPWMNIPLVFTATGELDIGRDALSFWALRHRAPGWHVRGVRDDLRFDLSRTEILGIEPADWRSPMAAAFDIPFTRVRTSREGVLRDFRLCVGGRLSMARVREGSGKLRRALQDFAASAGVGPTR